MPTGSLCAERNVIGSALADNLGLRRKDLRAIAVYSAGMLGSGKISRKSSSLCAESALTSTGMEAEIPLHTTLAHSMRHILHKRAESWTETEFARSPALEPSSPQASAHANQDLNQLSVGRKSHRTIHSVAVRPFPDVSSSHGEISNGMEHPEAPRIVTESPALFVSKTRGLCSCPSTDDRSPNPRRRASRTINVEEGDMNPLKPCGACLEWLKKIAEVNPEFLIVTFTDLNCEGIYVEQVDTAM